MNAQQRRVANRRAMRTIKTKLIEQCRRIGLPDESWNSATLCLGDPAILSALATIRRCQKKNPYTRPGSGR